MANGAVTVTRSGRLERAVDDRERGRLHDCLDGHRLGGRPDDHRQRRHARRRRDDDDRLRLHGRRRPGRNGLATAGANAFPTQQRSTAGGILANIGASPSVNVYAADGSGTVTTPTANVVNGSTNTIVFTYKAAAAGGTSNGSVTVTVPTGWPAPTAGNTTSSLGARSYAGQTVTVSGLTLAANATFTITYGPAAAPTTGGPQVWSATERSTAGGALAALALSPSINVYAPDGSGTLTAAPALVGFGSNGNTETFTYTAATGGTSNGSVTVVVPAGWNAPSTTAGNPGNTARARARSRSPARRSRCRASRSPAARR